MIFRWKENQIGDKEIAEINKREKRKNMRAFLPAQEAARKAWKTTSLTPERALALVMHPDERVPISLCSNNHLWEGGLIFGVKGIKEALRWQAVKRAREEGLAWTPLLDAVANTVDWPERDQRVDNLNCFQPTISQAAERRRKGKKEYVRENDPLVKLIGPDEVLPSLENYMKEISDKIKGASMEERLQVKYFRSNAICKTVIKLTSPDEWSVELVDTWTRAMPEKAGEVILSEELNLSDELRRGVLDYVKEKIPGLYGIPQSLGQRAAKLGYFREEPLWSQALQAMDADGYWSKKTRYLWAWLTMDMDKITSRQWDQLRPFLARAAEHERPYNLKDVLDSPLLTKEDVFMMLDSNRTSAFRGTVASHKSANVPGVAERLAGSKNTYLTAKLASNVVPQTYGRIFKKLVKNTPETALKSLENRQETVAEHVKSKDMAPLFVQEDKDKRLRVIKLSSKVGAKKSSLDKQ